MSACLVNPFECTHSPDHQHYEDDEYAERDRENDGSQKYPRPEGFVQDSHTHTNARFRLRPEVMHATTVFDAEVAMLDRIMEKGQNRRFHWKYECVVAQREFKLAYRMSRTIFEGKGHSMSDKSARLRCSPTARGVQMIEALQ